MALFGFTTLSATPASPTSTLSIQVEDTSEWPAAPFVLIIRRPKVRPSSSTAEAVTVASYTAGGAVTLSARALLVDGFQTVARSLKRGDECYPLDVQGTPIEVSSAAALESLIGNGRWLVVPAGLGDLQLTTDHDISGFTSFRLDVGPGSAVVAAANKRIFYAGAPTAPSLSTGTAFTGAVTDFATKGTLTSGSEGLAAGDYACMALTGAVWQVLHVRDVSGSTISFYSGFAAPFTTSWKLHKLTPSVSNITLKGKFKRSVAASAGSLAVSITGGINLDFSDMETENFTGDTNNAAVFLHTCYDVKLPMKDYMSGGNNGSFAAVEAQRSSFINAYNPSYTVGAGQSPLKFAYCTDLKIFGGEIATGGRNLRLDTCYRVHLYGLNGSHNGNTGGVGILIYSDAGLGAPFAGAHYYLIDCQVHGAGSYGLDLGGNGADDIHVIGGDYTGNGVFSGDQDIALLASDTNVFLDQVKYNTIAIGHTSYYINTLGTTAVAAVAIAQSVTVTTVAVTRAAYVRNGKMVDFEYVLQITTPGATANGNDISVALPAGNGDNINTPVIGAGTFFDASTGFVYPFVAQLSTVAGFFKMLPSALAGQAPAFLGNANSGANVALAAGDIIKVTGRYFVS